MKKILYSVMALAIAAMTFTACEDVPEPYPTPNGGETTNGAAALPYTSANLNTGWTLVEVTAGAQPWSLGQSYAQATGYQKWDGASTKSNKAVEGWLVSPAISTYGKENVKLSFNHTIKYTNNVSNWAANHKVYISTDFDGSKATWTELDFTPVASPYASSDWTLYSSGEIQLPAQFVGKEAVYIGFWFKAPADASTTWELQTFKMEEGIAENTPEPTPTEELGTAEAPLTVAKAIETINKYADNGTSTAEAYVKGTIVSVESYNSQYKSITYWISDDGTENGKMEVYSGKGLNGADFTAKTDLHKGAVVVVKGTLKKFVNNSGTVVQEFDKNNVIVSITNNEGGDTPQPTGNYGTAEKPLTVAKALDVIAELQMKGTTPEEAYVKGVVVSVESYNSQYKSLTYWISDDGTENGKMEVYSGKGLNGADFTATTDLHKGAVVVVKGILKKFQSGESYVPEFDKNSVIISITNNEGGNDNPTTPDTPSTGEGSYAQPFSVANVIAKGTANSTPNVYVKAYIVGWVEGQVLSTGAKFNSEGVTVDTNILIADAANEGDVTKCVPVQLPKGAIRTGLNLKENPGLLGKQVILYGNLEKYFGAAGIKSVSYAECNGNSIGTKP